MLIRQWNCAKASLNVEKDSLLTSMFNEHNFTVTL